MIFVGYEPGSKAYRAYDHVSRRVHITRDAVFNESARWDWGEDEGDISLTSGDAFTIEHMVHEAPEVPGSGSAGTPVVPAPSTPPSGTSGGFGTSPPTPVVTATTTPEFVSPLPSFGDLLDAADDNARPHRFRMVQDVLTAGPAAAPTNGMLHLIAGEEPATFSEAEQRVHWRRAMLEEMSLIEGNATWCLAELQQATVRSALSGYISSKRTPPERGARQGPYRGKGLCTVARHGLR
jgi:hypothetical protein